MDLSREIGFGSYCFWNDRLNTKLSANALEAGSTSTCNSIYVTVYICQSKKPSQVSKWVSIYIYVYTYIYIYIHLALYYFFEMLFTLTF